MTEQPTPRAAQERVPLGCPFCGELPLYCEDDSYGSCTLNCVNDTCPAQPGVQAKVGEYETLVERWTQRPTPPALRSLGEAGPSPADPRALRERTEHIDIVFDGPPGPEAGRFVEVEDGKRRSIQFGEWVYRDDGYWVLRITLASTALFAGDGGSEYPVVRKVAVALANALEAMRMAAVVAKTMNGREYIDLGIQVSEALVAAQEIGLLPSPPLARPAPEQEGGR